jgi:hypothetical protein
MGVGGISVCKCYLVFECDLLELAEKMKWWKASWADLI